MTTTRGTLHVNGAAQQFEDVRAEYAKVRDEWLASGLVEDVTEWYLCCELRFTDGTTLEIRAEIGMRDDLAVWPKAERRGFTVKQSGYSHVTDPRVSHFSHGYIPANPLSFEKGNRIVWRTSKGWCVALKVAGKYRKHEYFDYVMDALDRADELLEATR